MTKLLYERPLFSLLENLYLNDIRSLTRLSKIKKSKLIDNPLQEIVINMLLYDGCIVKKKVDNLKPLYEYQFGSTSITYLYGRGHSSAQAFFTRTTSNDCVIDKNNLLSTVTGRPLIIVDLKYWDLLLKEEQNRLINQLIFTLYSIRKYLWDLNLVLTNTTDEVIKRIENLFGFNKVLKTNHDTEDFLCNNNIKHSNVILLDPNANKVLSSTDIFNAEAFIVGGIVDRIIPRKGLTSTLVSDPNIKRRKITLKNSIIGVPFSVNKIVEIILRSRYETGGNINLAIRKSLSKRDIKWRIRYECSRLRKSNKVDLKRIYNNIKMWLPVSFEEFKHLCIKAVVKAGIDSK